MKKLLFIINSLRVGGAEKMLIDTLQQIDYTKYDVTLMYFFKDGVFFEDIPSSVTLVNPIKMGGRIEHHFRMFLSKVGLLNWYYRRSIQKCTGKYDTIISYLEGFPTRMHSLILDKASHNISFIHTDLETYRDSSNQFDARLTQEQAYSKLDKLVFVSNHALEAFKRVYPNVTTEKLVLRNFIDIEAIQRKSEEFVVPRQGFTVVIVGRLSLVKGVDIIPEIACEVKKRGYHFYFNIVGSGKEEDIIRKKIKTLCVADCVNMAGFQMNPYPYMRNANVYINTSHTEGLPLSLCEAMSLGKPVVASNTSGSQELLSNGVGCIVNRDVDSFVEALIKLFTDENVYKSMSERGKAAANTYDKSVYMNDLYNLI